MLCTVGAAAKVFTFLDRKSDQKEAGELAPAKLQGKLAFHNVSFYYPSRPNTPALKVSIHS